VRNLAGNVFQVMDPRAFDDETFVRLFVVSCGQLQTSLLLGTCEKSA